MWILKDVDYILVELVDAQKVKEGISAIDVDKDVYHGMFAGLKIVDKKDGEKETSILLYDNKNQYHILDITKFNVMSIEKQSNDTKNCLYLRAHEEDQIAAIDLLETIVEEFTKQDRMVDKSLTINTDSYCNLPESFTDKKTVNKKPGYSTPINNHTCGAHHRRANSTAGTRTTSDPDPSPTHFRRTTKKPNEEDLTNLQNMVILIAQGTYEEQVFPVIEKDDEPGVADDDEYDKMYGGFC
jgi:hypothetical protein